MTMTLGMLWFVPRPMLMQEGIIAAAKYHLNKYGRSPDCCYVHIGDTNDVQVENLSIHQSKVILPRHIWIGISDKL